MALRAGYYGIKRGLKAKLAEIAGTWDQVKNEVDHTLPDGIIANTKLISSTVGWVSDNLFDVGDSINDWFATSNNGLNVQDGSIAEKVTATMTRLTGSIAVTNYVSSGYWWMSKEVILEKNTDYIFVCKDSPYSLKVVGSNDNTTGTQIDTFQGPKKINSGNYTKWWVSIYPASSQGNFSCSNLMVKDARILEDTFRAYHVSVGDLLSEVDDTLSDHKTTINAIISAATGAADFAAFKTAMGAITPLTRSIPSGSDQRSLQDITPEVEPEEKEAEEASELVTKKRSTKKTVKEGE